MTDSRALARAWVNAAPAARFARRFGDRYEVVDTESEESQ